VARLAIAKRDARRRAGAAEGCVDEIAAGVQLQPRRTAFRGGQQRQLSVIAGLGAEDAPDQPVLR
jgi:hypothetical protein